MRKSYPLLLLFAFSTIAVVSCDSADDSDDYAGILGRWEPSEGAGNEGNVYLNIFDDEIVVHIFDEGIFDPEDDADDCFERNVIEVISRDEDEWTLRDRDDGDDTETFVVRFQRDGDGLVVEGDQGEETERYERSTRTDFTPLCD